MEEQTYIININGLEYQYQPHWHQLLLLNEAILKK